MGLLSSVGKVIKKVATVVGKKLTSPIAPPLTKGGGTISPVDLVPMGNTAKVVAATPSVVSKVLSTAKSLIPSTFGGKLLAAATIPTAYGFITADPKSAAGLALKAPAEFAQLGGDLQTLGADPSLENLQSLIKNSPVILGAGAVVATILGAKTLLPAVTGLKQAEALQDISENLKQPLPPMLPSEALPFGASPFTSPIPLTQQTMALSKEAGGLVKRRKRQKLVTQTPRLTIRNQNIQIVGRYANC